MKGRTILVAAVFLVVALPAEASAQSVGQIGGPPTMGGHLRFPPPHKKTFFPKATSEAIVIGVGSNAFGRVEIVGQGIRGGLCIFLDHLKRQSGNGSCGPMSIPKVIEADMFTWESRRRSKQSMTELSGFTQPTVGSVTAVAHVHKGRKRMRKAVPGIIAMPSSEILARLHQGTPFGYFVADFRGCLSAAKVRLHAFDLSGALLGTSRTNLGFPKRLREIFDPCEPGTAGAGFAFVEPARVAVAP